MTFGSRPIAGLLLLAAALVLPSCQKKSQGSDEELGTLMHPVQIVTMETVEEPVRLETAGEVQATHRIEVASKTAGHILDLPVTEGTPVKKGDLLVRLDAPELTAAFAETQAAEEAAQVSAETASRQAARFRRLAASNVVTPHDLEMAETAAAQAQAGYERAKAARIMSERNLDYAVLRAPESGVVVRRLARAGDLATPGRPLVVMETGGGREVRVTWPAELEWPATPGSPAEVQVPRRDTVLPAKINRVSPSADDHTLEAFLSVEGLDVPSGTFVDVVLLGDPAPVLRLPDEARVERGSLAGAFTVEDGRASLRWLRLTPDGRVLAGLSPGDRVILNPPADLKNGDAVEAGS